MFRSEGALASSQRVGASAVDWITDARSCTTAVASLHQIENDGSIGSAILASSPIDAEGKFTFAGLRKNTAIDLNSKSVKYVIKASGCDIVFYRPLLGSESQDITLASSLLALTAKIPDGGKKRLSEISVESLQSLEKSISEFSGSDLTQVVNQLIANPSVSDSFQSIFNISPMKLKELPPPGVIVTAPLTLTESSSTGFSANLSHWNSDFAPAYEWQLNGIVVGSAATYTHVTGKNSQGPHSLVLRVGSDNAGSLDLTKAMTTKTFDLIVLNTQPAIPPAVTLVGNNLRDFLNTSVSFATGAGLANCESFSRLGFSESALVPPLPLLANFPITCTMAGVQTESFSISAGEGPRTLALWAMDAAGNVSASASSVQFTIDQSSPAVTLANLNNSIRGGQNYSVVYTVSDISTITDVRLDYASDGVTFTEIANLTSGASPYVWSVPATNTTGSRLRLRVTDAVGLSATLSSNAFNIDSIAPVLTQTTIAQNPRHTNTSTVTFGGLCENGLAVNVTGADTATATCTGGAWSYTTNSRTTDASYSYVFSQTDGAGNSTALSSQVWIRDTVLPVVSWASPAANTSAISQIAVSGGCESGLPVNLSGSGVLSSLALTCNAGSFSTNLFFSADDGVKTVTLSQTDLAGNVAVLASRNFVRDSTKPALTIAVPLRVSNQNTTSFSGSCEAGLGISVTGADTTSISCTAGAWSYTTAAKATDGVYAFTFSQTDLAGNSESLSGQFTRDTVLPVLVRTSTNPVINAANSANWTGTCEAGLVISITGSATTSTPCTGGAWSFTDTSMVNGTRGFSLTQTDAAGNVSAVTSLSWVRDTTIPNIQLGSGQQPTIRNSLNGATWSGTCESAIADIVVSGADSQTIACAGGTWSYTAPTQTTDLSRTYVLTQTNTVPTSASLSLTWIRDTTVPTLTSAQMSINGGATTTSSRLVSLSLQAVDVTTRISHFCLKTTTGAVPGTPAAGDACWTAVNAPIPGLSLSSTLNLTNFSQSLDFSDATYTIFAWVRDEVGNTSSLSNAGNGTAGQDKASIQLIQGAPPVVTNVFASRTDTSYPPLLGSDETISAGNDVYIKWNASDTDEVLGASSIRIFFTTNDTTWTEITSGGIPNAINGACTLDVGYSGCYRWTMPTGAFTRFSVQVTDSTGKVSSTQGNALNTSPLRVIAGDTNNGIGGDGKYFVQIRDPATTLAYLEPGGFVVNRSGDIFVRDYNLGIVRIRASDGLATVFLRQTGTFSGDGGSVLSATASYVYRLLLDPQDRIILWDGNRIRRINMNLATPTIETIIGGGADTAATVANPLNVQLTNVSRHNDLNREIAMVFTVSPNGTIYFQPENYAWNQKYTANGVRVRKYNPNSPSTPVESLYITGTGMDTAPSESLEGCVQKQKGLGFDSNGALEYIYGHALGNSGIGSGIKCLVAGIYSFSADVSTGLSKAISTYPILPVSANSNNNQHYFSITSRRGKIYLASREFNRIYQLNYDISGSTAGTLTHIFGSGTRGSCADGTAATACAAQLEDIFIDEQDRLYFVDDGQIRFVKSDLTVQTIAGRKKSVSTPQLATRALFPAIASADIDLSSVTTKPIVLTDSLTSRLYEVTPGGNSKVISGNGGSGWPAIGGNADNGTFFVKDAYDSSQVLINPLNGLIYYTNNLRIAALNRITNAWTSVIGNGATRILEAAATPGANISFSYIAPKFFRAYRPFLVGINDQKLLFYAGAQFDSLTVGDAFLFTSDHTDLHKTSLFAGSYGLRSWSSGDSTYVLSFCADGTLTDNCQVSMLSEGSAPATKSYYDPVDGKWIIGTHLRNRVMFMKSGQNVSSETIATNYKSIAYRREAGSEVIYYCSATDHKIYRKVLGQVATALNWPSSSIKCSTPSLLIDESRSVLIFPFTNNGLSGLAEYSL